MDTFEAQDLSKYDNRGYVPGASLPIRALWYAVNALVLNSWWVPCSGIKVLLLRMFGAKIGLGVVIKPRVNIKYPWHLKLGRNVWIGEDVWIDNLMPVTIGDNVCLSQNSLLLTGNHDYRSPTFDLMAQPITIADGVWIAARVVVCSGAYCGENCVVTVGSVAVGSLEPNFVYSGTPAVKKRARQASATFGSPSAN